LKTTKTMIRMRMLNDIFSSPNVTFSTVDETSGEQSIDIDEHSCLLFSRNTMRKLSMGNTYCVRCQWSIVMSYRLSTEYEKYIEKSNKNKNKYHQSIVSYCSSRSMMNQCIERELIRLLIESTGYSIDTNCSTCCLYT
jgi:hypothetical protein